MLTNIIEKRNIMDIPFVNASMDHFMSQVVEPVADEAGKCFIITANPEIVMTAKRNTDYEHVLQTADYVVPDGIGILLAAKLKKTPLQARIPGVELMEQMLQLADRKKLSCYFLGATDEVNQVAVTKIQEKYPNMILAGRHHGYFEIDDENVAAEVQNAAPDFIFVALGVPKQEQWIATHQSRCAKGIFMGVGGSFDIFAGHVQRAPTIWITLRLEWLYRLFKQPSRLKRIGPLFVFAWRALLKK